MKDQQRRFRSLGEIIDYIDVGRTDQVWMASGYSKQDMIEDLKAISAVYGYVYNKAPVAENQK